MCSRHWPGQNWPDLDSDTIEHSITVLVQYCHKGKYNSMISMKLSRKILLCITIYKVAPIVYTYKGPGKCPSHTACID